MAQRLLRIVVSTDDRERLREIVEEHAEEIALLTPVPDGSLVGEVIVPAEGNEPLLDALTSAFESEDHFRLMLLPLAATLPRPRDEDEEEESTEGAEAEADAGGGPQGLESVSAPGEPIGGPTGAEAEEAEEPEKAPSRISREELYDQILDLSELSLHHLLMVGLSAVVASVGLLQDSSAVVVGAMVIAPLIGPNMGLALSATLGDVDLGREAIRTGVAGIAVAFVISVSWGVLAEVDPTGEELIRATQVGYQEIALALAAGGAGALSVSRGTATALVGVMVAVALLPPLVAAGLLLGSGFVAGAAGGATVVAANVICINLAGVVTFLAQGVRPRTWWDENRARTATRIALVVWVLLLLAMMVVIQQAGTGG